MDSNWYMIQHRDDVCVVTCGLNPPYNILPSSTNTLFYLHYYHQ